MLRILSVFLLVALGSAAVAEPKHGIAMHGEPALPRDFAHFPYVQPDVSKGGRISYGVVGTFDSLNPFVLRGMRTTARGIWDPEFGNLFYETLMQRSSDEGFSLYGLLAESVEWDDERSFIEFQLNPKARWHDGQPVTAEDVIFSFELLADKGRPPFSSRMQLIERIEKVGERGVRFTFNERANRETPLLVAMSPILPKHAIDPETFDRTSLQMPIGSGPYKIKSIRPGERITYERDPNYWAKDLPTKIGLDNYDEISVTYFLQNSSLFEAFKKGIVDIYPDGDAGHWARDYDFPAARNGDIVKEVFEPKLPTGMFGFVFNTRRPLFADERVREALSVAFDFNWVNRSLFGGAFQRSQSFWQNSVLGAYGNAADARELALLGPAAQRIPEELLAGTYTLPETDSSGADRTALRRAFDLLKEAGFTLENRRMVNANGRQLSFEIMTQNQAQEKMAIAYQRTLALIGVAVQIRTVDDAQYQARSSSFDYDMILKSYPSTLSPGAEQINRWGSAARDASGSFNYAGVADPDIDRMIASLIAARGKEDFQAAVRGFDRLLVAGHYVIPLYYSGVQWVARWKRIGRPEAVPLYGYSLPSWFDARVQ